MLVCYICTSCVSTCLFADDIFLLSPTLTGLQTLFNYVNVNLKNLKNYNRRVNAAKSMCIRFGHRFDAQ